MIFSIIIPTCNRNDLLKKCLDALQPDIQNFPIEEYEIIVSDDSKENLARELIKNDYDWIKWVSGSKKGPAANRNNGAKNAKGEWLIFLDDDVIPDHDILNNYKKGIELNPNIYAFEGSIIPDNWDLLKKDLAECPININGNCFWSANIMVQKDLFSMVNGFDEDFSIAAQEDQMLFFTLKKHTQVLFLNSASVSHPVRFISLSNKLKGNRALFNNWVIFKKKQGYTYSQILEQGYKSQIKVFIKNIKSLKLKQCILNLNMIFIQLGRFIFAKK